MDNISFMDNMSFMDALKKKRPLDGWPDHKIEKNNSYINQ